MKRLLLVLLFSPAMGFCQDTLPASVNGYFPLDGPCNPCVGYPSFVTGCRWFTVLDSPFGGLVHVEAVSPRPAYLRVDSGQVRVVHDTIGMAGPVMSGMFLNWVRGGWSSYSFEVGGTYGDSLWINLAYDIQVNPVVWSSRDLCYPLGVSSSSDSVRFFQIPTLVPAARLEAESKYKKLKP